MAKDGRSTSRYWVARGRYIAQARREHRACAVCGAAIDWQAPPRGAMGPSVDHVVPLAVGGSLLDQSNWQLAHVSCNAQRGARLGVALGRLRRGARVRRTRGRSNTGGSLVPETVPIEIGSAPTRERGGWYCDHPEAYCDISDDGTCGGPHSLGQPRPGYHFVGTPEQRALWPD